MSWATPRVPDGVWRRGRAFYASLIAASAANPALGVGLLTYVVLPSFLGQPFLRFYLMAEHRWKPSRPEAMRGRPARGAPLHPGSPTRARLPRRAWSLPCRLPLPRLSGCVWSASSAQAPLALPMRDA